MEQRSKRQKVDKSALFERIKKLKGSKNKYQITEVQNVYEVVDEKEYSKRVIDAKESGWIIDGKLCNCKISKKCPKIYIRVYNRWYRIC